MSPAAKGPSSASAQVAAAEGRGGQKGGPAKIKSDDIAALKAHGVGGSEIAKRLGIGRTGLRSVSLLVEGRGDEPEGAAVPATGRPLHRGDRRHGLSGVFAACVRQRRHRRPIRHECRHRAAVFPTWGAAFTPGGFRRRISLAAAHRRACLDFRSVPCVGPWREGPVSRSADAATLDWRDLALRIAFDSPIVDRLYLDRWRQRPGRALRRDRIQPFGHGIDAAAGRAAARRAGWLLGGGSGDIVLQLLLPFAAGQLARPWMGDWALRHKTLLGLVDRGSILLVVYAAFSEGVTQGIWRQLTLGDLGQLLALDIAVLAAVLAITTYGSRLLRFSRADEETIVFCGSKKSLASGLPMATVLLAGQSVGLIVLPLMLFHQIQLMVCAVLAKRYADTDRRAARQAPDSDGARAVQ